MKLPAKPPAYDALFEKYVRGKRRLPEILTGEPAPAGRYRHWDKLRRLTPPAGLTHEEWWFATKLARQGLLQPLPLEDAKGRAFEYAMPDPALRMLHEIDRDASGELRSAGEPITNPATRDYYLVKSLMEEAITSSQLEGASTTRQVAAQMIRTGRAPRDKSERMILNNYQAIQQIRGWVGQPLTPERVLELHRVLTEGTLDTPDAAGRLRHPDESVVVSDEEGQLLHEPPPADTLPRRMEAMCRFATGDGDKRFVHPVVRAILLHFWLAYDHPFVDGNGRTARALFYWSMLQQRYWLAEYISISRILREAPSRYSRAFLYTESDDNDTTYFLLFQMRVIRRAIADLHEYLDRKTREMQSVQALLRRSFVEGNIQFMLNHRQVAVISHALKHPDAIFTIAGHQQLHNVVYQTARTDLLHLAERDLLVRFQTGKAFAFSPAPDLVQRLKRLSGPGARAPEADQ